MDSKIVAIRHISITGEQHNGHARSMDSCGGLIVVFDFEDAMIFTFERTPVGLRVTSNEPVSEELLAMAGSSRLLTARMGGDAYASFAVHLVTSDFTGMQTLEIGDRRA